jgi:hypothetical protein
MVPVVGEAADLANAGWYAAEGKWADAALSAGSAIPIAGNFATAAKWGKRAVNAADAGADIAIAAGRAAKDPTTARSARWLREAIVYRLLLGHPSK